MEAAASAVGKAFATLGVGLSVAGFVSFVKGAISAEAALYDLHLRTGVTVETLSALKGVAKLAGTDLQTVGGYVNALEKTMGQFAATGTGKAANAFKQLGYSQADVKAGLQDLDSFLPSFAKRLTTTGQGGEQAALAMQLMKGAGAAALPFMHELAEQTKLVAKVTTESAVQAKLFEDNLIKLQGSSGKLGMTLANVLLPGLIAISDKMLEAKKNGEGFFGVMWAGIKQLFTGAEVNTLAIQIDSSTKALAGLQAQLNDARSREVIGLTDAMTKSNTASREREVKQITTQIATINAEVEAMRKRREELTALPPERQNTALAPVTDPAKISAQLEMERALLKVNLDAQKDYYANAGQLADLYHKIGMTNDATYYAEKKRLLDESTNAELAALQKTIDGEKRLKASSTDPAERINIEVKLLQDAAAMDNLRADAKAKGITITIEQTEAEKHLAEAIRSAAFAWEAVTAAEQAAMDVTRESQIANREEIEQLKFEGELIGKTAAAQALITAGRRADLALRQAIAALPTDGNGNFLAGGSEAFEKLQADFAKFKASLLGLTQDDTFKNWMKDQADAASSVWRQAGDDISDSLTKAFGDAGKSVGGMVKAFTSGIATQRDLKKKFEEDVAAAPAKRLQIETQYASKSTQNSLTMYADMAGAAASFFDEQSTAYKVLHGIEQALYAARLVMQITSLGVELGIISVGTAAYIASIPAKIAAGAASMFAQSGWGGFIGVAGMLAVMAGLGFASGGGGGGPSLPSAADAQRTQNTGTVLGDSSARSDSINHALDAIKGIDQLGLTYTRLMTEYLANISDHMSSLVGALSRVSGLTNSNANAEGFNSTTYNNPIGSTTRPILSSLPYNIDLGGKWVDSIVNRIFGTVTTSIINSGVAMIGTVADALKAPLIDDKNNLVRGINSFFTVNAHDSGGIFGGGGDTPHDEWRKLPTGVVGQMQAFLSGVVDSVEAAARVLGIWSPQLRDLLLNIPLDVKLSLDGLKGQELADAVNAFFASIADKIAGGLPTILGAGTGIDMAVFFQGDGKEFKGFQRAGEGAFETLIRVASEFDVVSHTFAALGMSLPGVSMATLKFSDELVRLMGGIDKFQQTMASYTSHYYSSAEQRAMTGNALNTEFSSHNAAMPTSLAGYRAMVDTASKDTTAAGAAFLAWLLSLEGVFYDFTTTFVGLDGQVHTTNDALEQHNSLQERLDLATGKRTQQQIDNQHLLDSAIDQTNLSLAQQIIAEEAINEYKKRAKDINQTNFELQNQLDVLTGKRSQKDLDRATRMDAIMAQLGITTNETTISLQQQIWAQEDMKDLLNRINPPGRAPLARPGMGVEDIGQRIALPGTGRAPLPGAARPGMGNDGASQGAASVAALNLELLRLTPGATAAAAVTRLLREAKMLELTAQEAQLGLAPGALTAIQSQINAQQDLNAAQTAAAEAAAKAANELRDFGAAMDKLHGNNAYSTQIAQWNAGNSIAAVTTAMPWIHDLNQLMSLSYADFMQYSEANRTLILTALNAGGALQDMTNGVNAVTQTLSQFAEYTWIDPATGKPVTDKTAATEAAKAKDLALQGLKLNYEIYSFGGKHPTGEAGDLLTELRKKIQTIEEEAIENLALRDLTHELNRLKNAAEDGASALEKANKKLEAQSHLQDWLKSVLMGANSPLTAQQQLEEARKQYETQLGLARGGNLDALGGIDKYADAFLSAQKAVGAFGGEYSAIFASIIADVESLVKPPSTPPPPTAGDNYVAATISSEMKSTREELATMRVEYSRLMERLIEATTDGNDDNANATRTTGEQTVRATETAAGLRERN